MGCITKCLTRKPATQHIEFSYIVSTINLSYITIYWETIHPAISLTLLQNLFTEIINFNTCTTLMTQYVTAIDTATNTSE